MSMYFTFGLSRRGSEAVVTLAVSHMTPRVVSSASQWQWPCGVKPILTYLTDVYGHEYMAKKPSVLLEEKKKHQGEHGGGGGGEREGPSSFSSTVQLPCFFEFCRYQLS